ncbi:MAG: DUF928 domain-containing protein [Actinomycetota bacterium]
MKHFINIFTLSLAFSVSLAIAPGFATGAQAGAPTTQASQRVNFKPPDVTAPGNRQAGGHRGVGVCSTGLSLTSLVPASNIGLTTQTSPTFFVYVPQTSAQMEFILLTEKEDEVVYQTMFKANNAGIVSVSLPQNTSNSLEVGKRYLWAVSMICDPSDRSADVVVKGWVQRVKPAPMLLSELQQKAEPRDRLKIYAENGLWYDTLSTLADLRRQAPNDVSLTADWTQLLKSQGLDTVAAQPLIQPQ